MIVVRARRASVARIRLNVAPFIPIAVRCALLTSCFISVLKRSEASEIGP